MQKEEPGSAQLGGRLLSDLSMGKLEKMGHGESPHAGFLSSRRGPNACQPGHVFILEGRAWGTLLKATDPLPSPPLCVCG